MGNAFEKQDDEHKTGTMLLTAIALNSEDAVRRAVEHTRRHCIKPNGEESGVEYDEMVATVTTYLTRKYDCSAAAKHITPDLTPLEFCKHMNAPIAEKYITETLNSLRRSQSHGDAESAKQSLLRRQIVHDYRSKGIEPPAHMLPSAGNGRAKIGEVTPDRAVEAKTKLQAFVAARNSE